MEKSENKASDTFEGALSRLEEVVRILEEKELPLEKSLDYFEEGIRLTRFCRTKLEDIETKVELLLGTSGTQQGVIPFGLEEE